MLKKIIIGVMFVTLSACSSITFDAMQFDRYVSLNEKATVLQNYCNDPAYIKSQLPDFQNLALHMAAYAKYRVSSPEVNKVTDSLSVMVIEFTARYQGGNVPSEAYCTEKLSNIAAGSNTVAATLGAQ